VFALDLADGPEELTVAYLVISGQRNGEFAQELIALGWRQWLSSAG
jgi:hypothetical protein